MSYLRGTGAEWWEDDEEVAPPVKPSSMPAKDVAVVLDTIVPAPPRSSMFVPVVLGIGVAVFLAKGAK